MAPDDSDYHKGTWSDCNSPEAKAGNSQYLSCRCSSYVLTYELTEVKELTTFKKNSKASL